MYGYVKNFDCGEIFDGGIVCVCVCVFFFFFFLWWGIDLFGCMIFGCEQFLVICVLVVGYFLDVIFLHGIFGHVGCGLGTFFLFFWHVICHGMMS